MSWFRLDDQMPWHGKIALAGGDAAWLWVCAGCWIAGHDGNGMFPKAIVPQLSDRKSPMRLAERLVGCGLWEDRGDEFFMHDYLDFNPSADEVAERRAQRAESGRIGGKRSGESRRSRKEATAEASASANGKQVLKQTGSENEPRTPLEEPNGSSTKRGYTKAERDPIFSALVKVFGEPKTRTTKTFYGASVTELLDAGATSVEVVERGRRMHAKGWPDCTPKALLKHWGTLAAPVAGFDPDAVSRGTA